MKRKTLLQAVHETALGLRDAGLMEPKTMREFDVLCLPRIKEYTVAQIKRIRERNKASQAVPAGSGLALTHVAIESATKSLAVLSKLPDHHPAEK